MPEWLGYPLLFVVGLVAGAINILAGGGSFLTLPTLIFLGLPAATLANGTNRVAILLQNVGAVWGFRRHGVFDAGSVVWAALPASVGALAGTWLALRVGDDDFRRILALLMVAITLLTLRDPTRGRGSGAGPAARGHPLIAGGFLLAGVYGGFVQAGVGFLILTVTTLAGLDLVRGNAVKVLCILVFTALSLAIFAWNGMVDWPLGLALAAGNVVGGQVGVRLTVLKGHRWVRRVVTIAVIVFAIRLWFG